MWGVGAMGGGVGGMGESGGPKCGLPVLPDENGSRSLRACVQTSLYRLQPRTRLRTCDLTVAEI